MEELVDYMREQLQQLEEQRGRARQALGDIESTISDIKQSTGYKVHLMLERNNLNDVKKINPKHDGTHVLFDKNEIRSDMLDNFKKFKLIRVYSENGSMVAVFE